MRNLLAICIVVLGVAGMVVGMGNLTTHNSADLITWSYNVGPAPDLAV